MSLGDVLGLLRYWSESPPAHVILAARYLDRRGSRRAPDSRGDDPENDMAFGKLGAFLGPPRPMKPYANDLLNWAETVVKT